MTKHISILALLFCSFFSFAQSSFEGVVNMTSINNKIQEKAEIIWYIKNGQHRLEYTGNKAGKSYTYVFIISNSSDLMQMLSDANGKKVIYDIPQSAISNSVELSYGSQLEKSEETKLLSGYLSKKVKVSAPDKISIVWVSDKTPLSMQDMPAILLNNSVLKSLKESGISAIPMEISSTNTGGNLIFSQKITSIKKKTLSEDLFMIPAEYQPFSNSLQID